MNVRAPQATYLIFFALSGAGLLGYLLSLRQCKAPEAMNGETINERGADGAMHERFHSIRKALPAYLLSSILITIVAHAWFNMHVVQAQGRHLFTAAPLISFLLASGYAQLTRNWRGLSIQPGVAVVIALLLFGMALYCLTGVILPAYE